EGPRRRGSLMAGGLGYVTRSIFGAPPAVSHHHPGLCEALHWILRVGYSRPQRARELIRALRGIRRMTDVAREEARLSPRRLDGSVVAEPPVEAHDGEHEEKQQESEERECGARIER